MLNILLVGRSVGMQDKLEAQQKLFIINLALKTNKVCREQGVVRGVGVEAGGARGVVIWVRLYIRALCRSFGLAEPVYEIIFDYTTFAI